MRRKADGELDENGLYALLDWAVGRHYSEFLKRMKRYTKLLGHIVETNQGPNITDRNHRRIRRICTKLQFLDMYREIADKHPQRKYILE